MKLINGKKLSHGLIYALSLIVLKTLKIYIKIHLKTGFIQYSECYIDAFIQFHKKSDSNLG